MTVVGGDSGFFGLIVALLLVLVLAFFAVASTSTHAVVGPGGAKPTVVAVGPTVVNGQYELPPDDTVVIDAVVNRGPLPPQYQAGYEIKVTATGRVTIVETPQGAAPGVPNPSATQRTVVKGIGAGGLQRLLAQLGQAGFFQLRNNHHPLIGGPESAISVTLADGTWSARAPELDAAGRARLAKAQEAIAAAVGYTPPEGLSLGG